MNFNSPRRSDRGSVLFDFGNKLSVFISKSIHRYLESFAKMVMIAKPLRRLRKTLKKLILRRGRKGSVQTFETPTSIAEAEVEGDLENPNTVEEVLK